MADSVTVMRTYNAFCGALLNTQILGILMVGLGCEVNQIDFLLDAYGLERGPKFQTMTLQDTGGIQKDSCTWVGIDRGNVARSSKIQKSLFRCLNLHWHCNAVDQTHIRYDGKSSTWRSSNLAR